MLQIADSFINDCFGCALLEKMRKRTTKLGSNYILNKCFKGVI